MWRAVVPLVCGQRGASFLRGVVDELVAFALGHTVGSGGWLARRSPGLFPGLAAVAGALDDLPEPAAGLRGIDTVGVNRRSFEMVDLPAGEQGAGNVP